MCNPSDGHVAARFFRGKCSWFSLLLAPFRLLSALPRTNSWRTFLTISSFFYTFFMIVLLYSVLFCFSFHIGTSAALQTRLPHFIPTSCVVLLLLLKMLHFTRIWLFIRLLLTLSVVVFFSSSAMAARDRRMRLYCGNAFQSHLSV